MERLSQTHEVPDLQNVMLEKFLDKVGPFFKNGFDDKDEEFLKNKFTEFFKSSTEIDFSKRLLQTFDSFYKWLGGNEWEKINKAASFCMPMLRVIVEKSLEISQRKNQSNNLIELKK